MKINESSQKLDQDFVIEGANELKTVQLAADNSVQILKTSQ